MVVTVTMMAIPAKRGQWKTLTLQDGTEVRATLVGDEHGHFWKAENGQAYIQQGDVYVAIDAQKAIAKAKARRAKVNAQRVQRRTFGHPTTILGHKKAIMILVNFKDKSFQTGHDNALFNRIANEEKLVPREWMNKEANYVTKDFVDYIRPLIQGDYQPIMVNGLPRHLVLNRGGANTVRRKGRRRKDEE